MIHVNSLTYVYPDGRQALNGLSFNIAENETVGLIGPNGAGKTTLFLCLCGVLNVKPGCIAVADLDPADARSENDCPRASASSFKTATISFSVPPCSTTSPSGRSTRFARGRT